MAKKRKRDADSDKAVYPAGYPEEWKRQVERQAFLNEPLLPDFSGWKRQSEIKLYYKFDDIFRKFLDLLKAKYEKKMKNAKKEDLKKLEEELNEELDQLLVEARLRRSLLSFESMKENYEVRKKEFEKVKKAFES